MMERALIADYYLSQKVFEDQIAHLKNEQKIGIEHENIDFAYCWMVFQLRENKGLQLMLLIVIFQQTNVIVSLTHQDIKNTRVT